MNARLTIGGLMALALCLPAAGAPLFRMDAPVETNRPLELTAAAVPLPAGVKVRVAFAGRATGRYTLEADERVRIMNPHNAASRLRVAFYTDQGLALGGTDVTVYVLSQAFLPYVRVFYPPAGAAAFRLFLHPAPEAVVAVKGLGVGTELETGERASLNPHPTFDYGDLNTYGYTCGYGGQFYTRPDGKTVWKTGFLGYSPSVPLAGDAFYTFQVTAKPYRGRKSYVLLDCYGAGKDNRLKEMRLSIDDAGATTELKMPAGTVSARLRCYSVILEAFRITPSEQ